MERDKPVMVFGYDIRKIPCFRNTFLYGISSGVAMGLAVFLFTSKPMLSTHSGFATYLTVGAGYWVICRIKYINNLYNTAQLQDIVEQSTILRGTDELTEESLKDKFKDV